MKTVSQRLDTDVTLVVLSHDRVFPFLSEMAP